MSRRLGHEDGFDRPAIRIQTSLEQVENGEVSEKKKRTIVMQWWTYAKTVVVAELRQKRAKENWAYIQLYVKRKRKYIDNWKKLHWGDKIWVVDFQKLKQVSLNTMDGNPEYMNITSLDDPRLQLVKHTQVEVKWVAKCDNKNINVTIEKDKKLRVQDIMFFGVREIGLD